MKRHFAGTDELEARMAAGIVRFTTPNMNGSREGSTASVNR